MRLCLTVERSRSASAHPTVVAEGRRELEESTAGVDVIEGGRSEQDIRIKCTTFRGGEE